MEEPHLIAGDVGVGFHVPRGREHRLDPGRFGRELPLGSFAGHLQRRSSVRARCALPESRAAIRHSLSPMSSEGWLHRFAISGGPDDAVPLQRR